METALKVQLKSYLYSENDDIRNLRSYQVMYKLSKIAIQDEYSEIVYLARFCLLLLCKVVQNQVTLVKFNVVPYLETFHLFPLLDGPAFSERVRWLAAFAKQSGHLALEGVINSLTITAMKSLKVATLPIDIGNCLKAISYLYMSGLCLEERYSSQEIKIVTEQIAKSVEMGEARCIKYALRAAGSFLMEYSRWSEIYPELAENLVIEISKLQEIRLQQIQPELLRQIINDAKLTLTLVSDDIIKRQVIEDLVEDEESKRREQKADNSVKSVLLKALLCDDVLLLCKALRSIGLYSKKTNCQDKGFIHIAIDRIKNLCNHSNPWIIREVALTLASFTMYYDKLELWLKFESNNFTLDSANIRIPKLYGSPLKLPPEKGMYRNWGVFFNFGDLLVLDNPIEFSQNKWSVSFWLTVPPVDTGRQHTLLQGISGVRLLSIDSSGLRLGAFDQKQQKYRNGLKMDKLKPYSWHNVIVTYDNGNMKFFIDYSFKKKIKIQCADPIKYIGNSADGLEPFGTICDLRISANVFTNKQLKNYSAYTPEYFDMQPDFIALGVSECVPLLIKGLHLSISQTALAILRVFGNLASYGNGRTKLIDANVIPQILTFLNSQNDTIRKEALRLFASLG